MSQEVIFHFTKSTAPGTVILRDDAMVLDVRDGYGPCLIVGKLVGQQFEGNNKDQTGGRQVHADWSHKGDGKYSGNWSENGHNYLFSFDLKEKK